MKAKYLNLALIIIIVLSIIINFNDFLMGNDASLPNVTITILYIIFWSIFIYLSKGDKWSLVFATIWALSTLICAALILAVNINDGLNLSFIIPFAMVFISPLYGLGSLFSKQEYLIASIIIIMISLSWVVMSLMFLKSLKSKKQIKS